MSPLDAARVRTLCGAVCGCTHGPHAASTDHATTLAWGEATLGRGSARWRGGLHAGVRARWREWRTTPAWGPGWRGFGAALAWRPRQREDRATPYRFGYASVKRDQAASYLFEALCESFHLYLLILTLMVSVGFMITILLSYGQFQDKFYSIAIGISHARGAGFEASSENATLSPVQ